MLAKKLGTPSHPGAGRPLPPARGEVDDAFVAEALKLLGTIAQGFGVTLLVETNGVYADTKRLRALLDKVAMPSVAALWDMHHPYRFMHESPEQTLQNLGTYINTSTSRTPCWRTASSSTASWATATCPSTR